MSAARFLTGLYPPAVRERWGADLVEEVSASGVRSWPDTVAGAARLWLHPADWPETSAGQTRHVVTVTVFALAAATGLLLRTVQPTATLTADLRHPVSSLWLAPLLLGVALATPLPPLRGTTLRRLAGRTVRTLAAPAAALSAMCLLAWSGATAHLTGAADVAALGSYWLTLGFVAVRGCTLAARVVRVVAPPSTRRLSAALLCLGAGLTCATGQSLPALDGAAPRPMVLAQAVALGLLAATALSLGKDLRGASG
jgi:hypothetical protein